MYDKPTNPKGLNTENCQHTCYFNAWTLTSFSRHCVEPSRCSHRQTRMREHIVLSMMTKDLKSTVLCSTTLLITITVWQTTCTAYEVWPCLFLDVLPKQFTSFICINSLMQFHDRLTNGTLVRSEIRSTCHVHDKFELSLLCTLHCHHLTVSFWAIFQAKGQHKYCIIFKELCSKCIPPQIVTLLEKKNKSIRMHKCIVKNLIMSTFVRIWHIAWGQNVQHASPL